jgi:hypothetical protein
MYEPVLLIWPLLVTNQPVNQPTHPLVGIHLVNKCLSLKKPRCPLPWSQKPASGSYPDQVESRQHSHTLFLQRKGKVVLCFV